MRELRWNFKVTETEDRELQELMELWEEVEASTWFGSGLTRTRTVIMAIRRTLTAFKSELAAKDLAQAEAEKAVKTKVKKPRANVEGRRKAVAHA